MDILIMLAAMVVISLIIIGTYLVVHRRRQHVARHKHRKIRL